VGTAAFGCPAGKARVQAPQQIDFEDLAAKRRKNEAHGESRGWKVVFRKALKGRKNSYDIDCIRTTPALTNELWRNHFAK
jgi:hypothetical protein